MRDLSWSKKEEEYTGSPKGIDELTDLTTI